MTWKSPYGKPGGLVGRLVKTERRLRTDRSFPWQGTGLIEDLRAVIQVLNKREWLERMRLCDDRDAQEFAAEVMGDIDRLDYAELAAYEAGGRHDLGPDGRWTEPAQAIKNLAEQVDEQEAAAAKAEQDYQAVRDVLVQVGALDCGDESTPVADLLRALLS